MTEPTDKDQSLVPDSAFEQPLARVSYQPGMLLGLEATRSEQDYHRRRLNRHAYWLHGSGTVCGLRVQARGDDPGNEDDPALVRLFVSPGIGVDGLGREVTLAEPHCIDLSAWLTTQYEDEERWGALIRDGYDDAANALWLKVTLRYQDCPSGLQPVLATDINAGTDPVKPSRIKDGALLELVPERPADAAGAHPFASHNGLPDLDELKANKLGPSEKQRLQDAAGVALDQLELGAQLLYTLGEDSHALEPRDTGLDAASELARTLLARVSIRLATDRALIVNPRRIEVDNLARPFLFNAELLARLARMA
jgi:hypothetical protein